MDYKATNVDGHEYHRFSRIVIDNQLNQAPSIVCVEQSVLTLSNGMDPVVRDVGNLNFPFDPSETFPLLNPATGEPTGQTITGAQVYAGIWSVVMQKAADRDAAIAAAEAALKAQEDARIKAEQEAASGE